ncbi:MAG: UDP-N-acetylmuramoyl-L-alanyl-D-glutamate--2,6-diaminopimelate ligase, partial [Verrucomicrobia bacterium]|nr:UDP-N-acetylmuramoyl-L-alanyl-D-glutamate--2,6-diaminopimelate ligase [Verrucomicrobiota bacterium]
MRLSHIIKSLSTTAERSGPDPDIVGIACNSRRVRQGFIFVAIPGTVANGWDFVEDAIKRGACAILSEHPPRRLDGIAQITVNDAHTAYAEMAAAFNGGPAEKLRVIGVTGTNGKTTTAYMIRDVLRAAGMDPGLLGTVAYELGERCIPAGRTTPDAGTIQSLLRQMVDIGCKSAVMEVSSHALVQKRTAAISFDVAIFTNLTRDHLDYHGTMEAYYEAKASLFRSLSPTAIAIINTDDAWGRKLQQEGLPGQVLTYGIADGADVSAESVEVSAKGCRFVARTPWGDERVELQLLGRHNVSNALACIASCCAQGVALPVACKALSQLATVRGRLEPVRGKQRFSVFVDYAHTDDALSHALSTVREFTAGRVIVVFGCGGDRDKSKRPAMGQVAAALADVAVVTSDNPRSEAPAAIITDILAGMDD